MHNRSTGGLCLLLAAVLCFIPACQNVSKEDHTASDHAGESRTAYTAQALDEEEGLFLVSGTEAVPITYELGALEIAETEEPEETADFTVGFDYAEGIPYEHKGVICDATMFRVSVTRVIERSSGDEVGGGTNKYVYTFEPKKPGTTYIIWLDTYLPDDRIEGTVHALEINEELKVINKWNAPVSTEENLMSLG